MRSRVAAGLYKQQPYATSCKGGCPHLLIFIAALRSLSDTKPHSQRNVLSHNARSSLTVPQAEQVLDVGNHLSICTTVLPVLEATYFSVSMKSEKPKSLTFRPHNFCMALIFNVSKHRVSYALQRWWASCQWNASRWLAIRRHTRKINACSTVTNDRDGFNTFYIEVSTLVIPKSTFGFATQAKAYLDFVTL